MSENNSSKSFTDKLKSVQESGTNRLWRLSSLTDFAIFVLGSFGIWGAVANKSDDQD